MMILLDTNVLSEILRASPDPAVLDWFSRQRDDELHVSAVTQAEMLLGVMLLPQGKRRRRLDDSMHGLFESDFAGRVLPFDSTSVVHYVEIVAARRRAGRPISQFDAQIAAIALQNDASLATRNVRDFDGCGLSLINPFA